MLRSSFANLARIMSCLCFTLICNAQEATTVSLQFLSFPKSISPTSIELLVGENRTIKLEVPSNQILAAQKVNLLPNWIFGETKEGEDGKPKFTVLGQAKALASSNQLILLVRKGATNADGFEIIPVDFEDEKFGRGKFLFMNAASINIAGDLGETKFVLKPGQHTVISPLKTIENVDKKLCSIEIFYQKGEKAKAFFTSIWAVEKNARNLIFVYHDSENKRLRLHTLQDF